MLTGCTGDGGGNGDGGDGGGGDGGGGDGGDGGGSIERWPQYRYDSGNTGNAPDATAPSSGSLSQSWVFSQDDTGSLLAPVVGDGLVVTAAGTTDPAVYAVDEASGKKQWEYSIGTPLEAHTLALVDGTVYVTDGSTLAALDAGSGSEQWTAGGVRELSVRDGTVYGTGNQGLVSMSAADGSENWTGGKRVASHAVGDGQAYGVLDSDLATVVAYDAGSGSEQWSTKPADDRSVSGALAVGGGTVYVPTVSGTLYALDGSSGEVKWSTQVFDASGSTRGRIETPAVADGTVVVGGKGEVVGLSASDGSEQWSTPADTFSGIVYRVHYVGDTVVAASTAIDPSDGSKKHTYEFADTGGAGLTSPVYANSAAYGGLTFDIVAKYEP